MAIEINVDPTQGTRAVGELKRQLRSLPDVALKEAKKIDAAFASMGGMGTFKGLQSSVSQLSTQLDKLESDLKGAKASSDILENQTKKTSSSLSEQAQAASKAARESDKLSKEQKELASTSKQVEEEFDEGAAALRRYLKTLKEANANFAKTNLQILKSKEAFERLEVQERKELTVAAKLADARKVVGTSYKAALTPMQQYSQKMKAITLLEKRSEVTTGELATKKAALRTARENAIRTLKEEVLVLTKAERSQEKYAAAQVQLKEATEASVIDAKQYTTQLGRQVMMLDGVSSKTFEAVASSERYNKELTQLAQKTGKSKITTAAFNEQVEKLTRSYVKNEEQSGKVRRSVASIAMEEKKAAAAMKERVFLFSKAEQATMKYTSATASLRAMLKKGSIAELEYATQISRRIMQMKGIKEETVENISVDAKYIGTLRRLSEQYDRGEIDLKQFNHGLKVQTVNAIQAAEANDKLAASTARVGAAQSRANVGGMAAGRAAVPFSAHTRALGNQSGAAFRSFLQSSGVGFGIYTTNTIAAAAATYGFTMALVGSVKAGAQFEKTFERGLIIMQEFRESSEKGVNQFTAQGAALREYVLELGRTSQFSANEVAEAMQQLAQAGQSPIEAYNSLSAVLDIATIGQLNMADSAKIAMNVMHGFGLESQDLGHIVDVLAQGINTSTAELDGLALALSYIGPQASLAGTSLEDATVAAAALIQVGIRPSRSGTGLRRILQNISVDAHGVSEAFEGLGLDYEKIRENGIDLLKVVEMLADAVQAKDMGSSEISKALEQIAGTRAVGALTKLVELATDLKDEMGNPIEGTSVLEEMQEEMENVNGVAEKMRKELQDNVATAFTMLAETIQNTAIQAFQDYGSAVKYNLDAAREYVNQHRREISEAISDISTVLIKITVTIVKLLPLLAKLALAFGAFKILKSLGSAIGSISGASTAKGISLTTRALVKQELAVNATTASLERYIVSMGVAQTEATAMAARVTQTSGAMTRRATRTTAAMYGLRSAGSGLMAMLGGPWGVALMAAAGALYVLHEALEVNTVQAAHLNGSLKMMAAFGDKIDQLSFDNFNNLFDDLVEDAEKLEDKLDEIIEKYHDLDNLKSKSKFEGADLPDWMTEENARKLGQEGGITRASSLFLTSLVSTGSVKEAISKGILQAYKTGEWYEATEDLKTYRKELERLKEAVDGLEKTLSGATSDQILSMSKGLDSLFGEILSGETWKIDEFTGKVSRLYLALKDMGELKNISLTGIATDLLSGVPIFEALLSDLIQKKKEDAEATRKQKEAEEAAEAARKKAISSITSMTEAYAKQVGSSEYLIKQLAELSKLRAYMSESGYSEQLTEEALASKRQATVLEVLSTRLSNKLGIQVDLAKQMEDSVIPTEQQYAEALASASVFIKKYVKDAELRQELLANLPELIKGAGDSTDELTERMKNFAEQADKAFLKWITGAGTLDQIADRMTGFSFGELSDRDQLSIAEQTLKQMVGTLPEYLTLQQKRVKLEKALRVVMDKGTLSLETRKRILDAFSRTTVIGKLREQIRYQRLYNQALMQGADAARDFQAWWKASDGGRLELAKGYDEATDSLQRLIDKTEELKKIRGTFKNFATGLGDLFTDVFSGGVKSFDSFGDRLKDLMKDLLVDLLRIWMRSKFVNWIMGKDSGGGSFWGSLAGIVGSLFSGGASAGGGGSMGGQQAYAGQMYVNGLDVVSGILGGGSKGSGGGTLGWIMDGFSMASGSRSGGGSGLSAVGDFLNLYRGGSNAVSWLSNLGNGSSQSWMGNLFGDVAKGWNSGGGMFSAQSWKGAGQSIWDGFSTGIGNMYSGFKSSVANFWMGNQTVSKAWSGFGAVPGYNYQGGMPGITGPYNASAGAYGGYNSAFGQALGVAGGVYAGYNRWQGSNKDFAGGVGALAYGAGTYAIGAGIAGIGGAGFAAGISGALAVPILGWIAAIAMIVDMIAGGKLFGTGFRPDKTINAIKFGSEGAEADSTLRKVREQSLFRGREWRNYDQEVSPEMEEAANKLYEGFMGIVDKAANGLETDLPKAFDAMFKTVTEYNDKGQVRWTKYFVDMFGKTWEEETADLAMTRISAEGIISVIDSWLSKGAEEAEKEVKNGKSGKLGPLVPKTDDPLDYLRKADELYPRIPKPGTPDDDGMGSMAGEASKIAERWRDDAEKLMQGAQFLLAASIDMKRGLSLIGESGPGSLTVIADLVEDLGLENEKLLQTYSRLKEETKLYKTALDLMGISTDKTGEEIVRLADAIATAAGGLKRAKSLWQGFFQAYYDESTLAQNKIDLLRKQSDRKLEGIGLDPDSSMRDFRKAFEAVFDSLSASEVVQWLEAAKALATVTDAMNKMEEAARRRAQQLSNFMFGIEGQLAEFEGRKYVHQFEGIQKQMKANIQQAKALGASEYQLSRIRQLAKYQMQQLISSLTASISGLAAKLFGPSGGTVSSASSSYYNQQSDHIADLKAQEMDRYRAAQSAIKEITEYLNDLKISDMAPASLRERLTTSREQFLDLVDKAKSGDVEAQAKVTDAAKDYLQLAREFFGSSAGYGGAYDLVTSMLKQVQGVLEEVKKPAVSTGGGSYGGGGAYRPAQPEESPVDRYKLALQLAQQLGQLAEIAETGVLDLMESMHIDITKLAEAFGIQVGRLDQTMVKQIGILAGALGVDSGTGIIKLLEKLGTSIDSVADIFGVSSENLKSGIYDGFLKLRESLGLSADELLNALGVSFSDLSDLIGNDDSFKKLLEMTKGLGMGIIELSKNLSLSYEWFKTQLAAKLKEGFSTIPDLPKEIKDQLSGYLEAIKEANSYTDLRKVMAQLVEWSMTLPEEQRKALSTLFDSLGIDVTNLGKGSSLKEVGITIESAINTQTVNLTGTLNETLGYKGAISTRLTQIRDAVSDKSYGLDRDSGRHLGRPTSGLPGDHGDDDGAEGGGSGSGSGGSGGRPGRPGRPDRGSEDYPHITASDPEVVHAIRDLQKSNEENSRRLAEMQGKMNEVAEKNARNNRRNRSR